MSEILRYPSIITKVEERFEQQYISGIGYEAVFKNVSLGWFVVVEGGYIFPCGQGKPEFIKGDSCRLTLEKI